MPLTGEEEREAIRRYLDGESPGELANDFDATKGSLKELMRRRGVIRSQSDSAKLAVAGGKKDKAIAALIKAAKTTNRYHCGKQFQGTKVCETCDNEYKATSARQKWCVVCCPGTTWRALIQRYGITKPAWDLLLEEQDGLCALCDKPPTVVDHDHETGKVRGLLCNACNLKLSGLDDRKWFERAQIYVRRT